MEQLNWYKIFYYVSMSDGIKNFFDVFSNITSWFSVLSFFAMFVAYMVVNIECDDEDKIIKTKTILRPIQYLFYFSFFFCIVTWFCYVVCPSKRDSMIIIAGGTVGNFITSDSSAKQLPSEALLLLRTKIKSEIEELKLNPIEELKDTLSGKSKEELIKLLKQK